MSSSSFSKSYPKIYEGSVKELRGPITTNVGPAILFEYSDSFSVFDWGRMPDLLPQKGEALAILASHLFERLERPESWKEFSKSHTALKLRKGNRFGSAFNELGETLQNQGLRTHYLGTALAQGGAFQTAMTPDLNQPTRQMLVRQVQVVRPALVQVLGRTLPDYFGTRDATRPRLIPLEVIFRFSCPPGSSLLERAQADPNYLAERGYPDVQVEPGKKWDFPVLEMFTKLESSDRPVNLTEGLAISGISAPLLQELLLKTAWVAGYLREVFASRGLELADGKLEWALAEDGSLMLVDAIGPDELRVLKNNVQLSKEFLRHFYRTTPWYEALTQAKRQAGQQGTADWKKLVTTAPPPLPAAYREAATQLYLALTESITGRKWFSQAWSLEKTIETLADLAGGGSPRRTT